MNILTVDDNNLILNQTVQFLKELRPDDTIYSFDDPAEALYTLRNECDNLYAAFLDVEMFRISGIEMAAELKKMFPSVHIVFVTAFPKYAVDAFQIRASGYVLKPVSKEKLEAEFNVMPLPQIDEPSGKRIRIHTFGNFEIFVDEKPVHFARSKSKELLAFLVDRQGIACTMGEITAELFEDTKDEKAQKTYLRAAIMELKKGLCEVNADDIIIKEHNSIYVDISKIDCDYYNFLSGDIKAINSFTGEYMTNYSWAEFTVAILQKKLRNK